MERRGMDLTRYKAGTEVIKIQNATEMSMSKRCNVCGGKAIHELEMGNDKHTMVFMLCDRCLGKLDEAIWERME